MSFTPVPITTKVLNADGTPGNASVYCTLTTEISNGGTIIAPEQLTFTSEDDGNVTLELYPNTAPGTIPPDSAWQIDIEVPVAVGIAAGPAPIVKRYYIVVPESDTPIELSTLL